MEISDLRVALFSGNYNYTRDGANISLNRLVGFLLSEGAAVRVYSPVVEKPAFPPTGDLVGVRSLPIPGRSEYRLALGIGRDIRRDVLDFAPNMFHLSAPDTLGHWALALADKHGIPTLASVHTRFDLYLQYYSLGWFASWINSIQRRFYQRCDAIVAPSQCMVDVLRDQRIRADAGIWPSGVDRDVFNPDARSNEWRRSLGIGDGEVVVGFLGRLVLEKGVDAFCDTIDELSRRGITPRVLVVGDGPARKAFANRLPQAVFVGFQTGESLSRAVASMDVFLNPSGSETFGIVTLEAMSCGLPVVGVDAPGTSSLVVDGVTGRLVAAGDIGGLADAVAGYVADPVLRAETGAAGVRVSTDYTWDAVNRTLAGNYLRLLGGGK